MDSSVKGQTKGVTAKKPLAARTSLSRITKTGSPSSSPKVATESPGPAASRHAEPTSRPAAKATPGAKQSVVNKSSTDRTMATSPIKSRTLQHRETASPVKPPSNQTARLQNGDKGTQKTASPLPTKTEAGKKSVEGAQKAKPKATQEGEVSTPTKRNGAVKREVSRLPEHGLLPKDKSPALRLEKNLPGPVKPPVTAANNAKPLKAPSMSNKPTERVPAPDKPTNSIPLSAKGVKSPSISTRPSGTPSATVKPVKTLSPLVKTSRTAPVSTKPPKTPTTAVNKPVNTISAAAKPAKTPPVKSVNATTTPNSLKQGKPAPAISKQTSVPPKPAAAKQVKSTPPPGKPVNGKGAIPKVPRKVEPSNSSGEPIHAIDLINQSNAGLNVNEKLDVNASPGPVSLPEELVDTLAVLVNKDSEHTMADNVETAGKVVEESKLAIESINPSVATDEASAEPNLVDAQVDLSNSLEQIVTSPIKQVTAIEAENNWETVSPSSEDINSLEEQIIVPMEDVKAYGEHKLRSPPELENHLLESTKPLEREEKSTVECVEKEWCNMEGDLPLPQTDKPLGDIQKTPVEPLQKEMSHLDVVISLEEADKPLVEDVKTPGVPMQEELSHLDQDNPSAESNKLLVEVVETPVIPLQEDMSSLEVEKLSDVLDKPLAEQVETPIEPLEEEISHLDLAKPLTETDKTLSVLKPLQGEEGEVPLLDLPESSEETNKPLEKVESFHEEPHIPIKPLDKGVTLSMEPLDVLEKHSAEPALYCEEEFRTQAELAKPMEESGSLLQEKGLDEEQCKTTQLAPSDEVLNSPVERDELLEEELTPSLEQVTPLGEEVNLLEDEIVSEVKPETLLKQQVGNPANLLEEPLTDPETLTSSTEEGSSSDEDEDRLLKGKEETLNLTAPEYGGAEEVTCLVGLLNQTANILPSLAVSVKPSEEEINTPVYTTEGNFTSPNESEILLQEVETPTSIELEEPIKYLEGLEGSAEESLTLIEGKEKFPETAHVMSVLDKSSQEEIEGILMNSPVKTNWPMGQLNPTVEPVKYHPENHSDSTMEFGENLWNNKAKNMDKEVEEVPPVETVKTVEVTEGLLDGVVHKTSESFKGPSDHVITVEKQLDSAQTGIDDVSSPIKVACADLESVLLSEEPLIPLKDSEAVLLEMAEYPEMELKSSFDKVKLANTGDEAPKLSTWEFTSAENLVIASEISFIAISEGADTAVCPQPVQNTDISVKESAEKFPMPDKLPMQQHNDLLDSPEVVTRVDIAPVDNSAQFDETSINTLVPIESDTIKPREDPLPAEVLTQSEEPYDTINKPVVTTKVESHQFNDLSHSLEEPLPLSTKSVVSTGYCTTEFKTVTPESERSPHKLISTEFTVFADPAEKIWNINTEHCLKENNSQPKEVADASHNPVLITEEDSVESLQKTDDLVEDILATNSTEALVEKITHSDESVVPPAEERETLSVEENCDVLLYPSMPMEPLDFPQESQQEPWVLVQKEELSDFKEMTEEKPLRPASLNQEGEAQEEQTKPEEDVGERASVCSTLSDPQLAGQSSSETSTPEELKTYEDTSSGVESHSDDVATSPQTTLTPDPDLGIHMGQEEGADTPAGTPASNSKGVPHPLQNPGMEGQSQEMSPSAILHSLEDEPIVRKREVTAVSCPLTSTVSREEKNKEGTEGRGAQRGNDD